MAPEVIACDQDPHATYDYRVSLLVSAGAHEIDHVGDLAMRDRLRARASFVSYLYT